MCTKVVIRCSKELVLIAGALYVGPPTSDHPMNTNLSLFNQTSSTVTAPPKYPLVPTYAAEYIRFIGTYTPILMLVWSPCV